MLGRVVRRTATSNVRNMATLAAAEEFPGVPSLSPSKPTPGKTETATLPNGMKLASCETSTGLVSMNFWLHAGCNKETFEQKGAAHLLAVGAFAGNEQFTGLSLIRDLDVLGAKITTMACREMVRVGVTVSSDNVMEVAELLNHNFSSSVSAFLFKETKTWAKKDYDNLTTSPTAMLNELIYEAAYGNASPLTNLYAENLDKVDTHAVVDFRNTHMLSGNVNLTAHGLSMEALKGVASTFSLPDGNTAAPSATYTGGEAKIRTSYGSSAVSIAFPSSTGDSSIDVIQKEIVYKACGMPVVPFKGTGIMGFHVIGDAATVNTSLITIANEMKAIATGTNTATAATANVNLGMKMNDHLMAKLLFNSTDATAASVKAAAASCLSAAPAFATLGNVPGTPDYTAVKGMFK